MAEIVEGGGVVDSIYLDFSKAFDTVPHRRLLGKLDSLGVRGELLKWIEDFLSGRTQVVSVNGESSEPAPVLSGIPQGSVLGPLLFVAFINDMPQLLKCMCYLFRRHQGRSAGQHRERLGRASAGSGLPTAVV